MKSSTLFVSIFLLILNSSNAIECAQTMDIVQGDISDWIFSLSDDVGCGGGTRGATTYRCTASSPDGGSELTIAFESSNLEKEPQSISFYSSNMAGYHDTHNFVDPCNAVAEIIEFYDTACLACEDFNLPPPANGCNMDDVQAEIMPWVLTKGVDGCGAGTRQATSYTCLSDGYYDDDQDGAMLKVVFESSNLEKVPQTMDFYYESGNDVRHNTHTFEEPCNAIAELSSFFDNDCNACDGFMTDDQCDAMVVHEDIRSFMNVQGFQCQDEDTSNYSCNPETTLSDGTTKVAKRPDGSTFELSVTSNADGSPTGISLNYIGGRGGATFDEWNFEDPCQALVEAEDFVQAMYDEFGMGEDEFAKPSNDEDISADDAAFPIYDCTLMDIACQTAYNTALHNWKVSLGETWTTEFNKCVALTPYSTEAISCYMAMNTSWYKENTTSTVEDTDVTTKSPEADISALSEGDEESSSSSLSVLMTMRLMTRIAAISVVTAVIVAV